MFADRLEYLVGENGITRVKDFLGLGIVNRCGKETSHEALYKELKCVKCGLCEPRTHLHEVDRGDVAVLFADDDILRDIDETAGEIARVRRAQCRVGKAFARAVRRDEVIGNGKTLTEVRRDRQVDDFTGRVSHQTAHSRELAHLLLIAARAGIRHHEDGIERIHVFHHGVRHVVRRLRPKLDDLLIALVLGDETAPELALHLVDARLCIGDDFLLLRRHDDVGHGDRHARNAGIVVAEIFHMINDLGCLGCTEVVITVCDEFAELFLVHQNAEAPLARLGILTIVAQFLGQNLAENKASERAADKPVALDTHRDLRLQIKALLLISEQSFRRPRKDLALTLCSRLEFGQVIGAEHHVLRRNDDGLAVFGGENVIRCQHEDTRLGLRLCRKRQMNRHLVAVKVGVVRRTCKRMELQRTPLGEHRFKCLNAETVERRSTIEEHGMLLDDTLEHIPNLGTRALNHALGRLDVVRGAVRLEFLHNKRLEKLERHLLRQTALMKFQLGTDDDNGTPGIVHALAEKVLTEPPLLALEHIREGFERTVAGSCDRAPAAAVVDECVDRFLEHPLLVAHDNVGRAEVEQTAQAVVAVDDAAVEIVEIRRRKAAAVELHHRAQVGRNDRNDVHDHPRRTVAGFAERLDHLKAADRTHFLLTGSCAHIVPKLLAHRLEIEFFEQLLHCLRAHTDAEGIAVFLQRFVILALGKKVFLLEIRFARIDDDVIGEIENFFERTGRYVEDQPHAARDPLEIPNMRDGRGEFNMPHALAAHLGTRDLDTAAVADDALVADALILAAVAFPVACRAEDALAEEAVTLRFERTVIDGLRLFDLAVRPLTNFIGGSESNPH